MEIDSSAEYIQVVVMSKKEALILIQNICSYLMRRTILAHPFGNGESFSVRDSCRRIAFAIEFEEGE